MNVHLGRELDQFIAGLLKTGLYQSQSEVAREALRLLKEREELKQLRLEELRRQIAIGAEQADRGEFVDNPGLLRNPAAAARNAGQPNDDAFRPHS